MRPPPPQIITPLTRHTEQENLSHLFLRLYQKVKKLLHAKSPSDSHHVTLRYIVRGKA